jgi:hypothetical protein
LCEQSSTLLDRVSQDCGAICERNPKLEEELMLPHLAMVPQQLIEHAFPRAEAG